MADDLPPPPTYTDIPLAPSHDRGIPHRNAGYDNIAFQLHPSSVQLHNISSATTSFVTPVGRGVNLPGIAAPQLTSDDDESDDSEQVSNYFFFY